MDVKKEHYAKWNKQNIPMVVRGEGFGEMGKKGQGIKKYKR